MDHSVLLSTHDLSLAGELRKGFQDAGYRVDFVTPDEDPGRFGKPGLLVLTGGVRTPRGRALTESARSELMIPVFGVYDGEGPAPTDLGLTELFRRQGDPDEILILGRTALERVRLQELTGIVGETDQMVEVLERVLQIAPSEATVLVTGESGTGKELVARGIHALSKRRHNRFLAVNVAALSDTLLESELFGHEKGAFTGAIDTRKGLFELADGGTIFLDEIGEMPLSTQTKLLRVLEQQEFLRVGGQEAIRVDVRIIAATNQRLRELVALREFRKDLYYRLNVLNISLPALRERQQDIPRLVRAFIRDASERYDREFHGIADDAMEILIKHSWPGNVRELRNLVESMVVLAPGRMIHARDIPDEVRQGERSSSLVAMPVARAGGQSPDPNLRPQLEFLFHTIMDMRVDMDEFRREFEAFRTSVKDEGAPGTGLLPPPRPATTHTDADLAGYREVFPEGREDPVSAPAEASGEIVYRPGMTMDELEREAIRATLSEVGGNRRRAAEMLEIGERTLYRKIKKFGLDD